MDAALADDRVVLVAGDGGNSLDGYARELAARLRAPVVPAPGSTGSFGHALLSRESLQRARMDRDLLRRLRRLRAPLLHFTSQHLARYGPRAGTPYIVTVHDLIRLSDWQQRHDREPLVHRPNLRDGLLMRADARGIRRAAAVLAVSEWTADELRSQVAIPDERLHAVPEGVDTSRFRPAVPPPGAGRYLLFVGSEQPRKNLRTLVRALAVVTRDRRHADLRLVKVGSPGGPEAPYRQRFLEEVRAAGVAERLVLPGRVPHDELLSWYSGAECLVIPSLAEGFGLPVLEAMACGCPVILPAETAQAEVGGFAAARYRPATDAAALAAAIRRLLDAPRYREEVRRRGFRRARELSWERTVERTRAVYASVLGASDAATEPAASSGGRHPVSAGVEA
ncbi:MAG: glycosyltransferase family 4 protein [Thermoleophilaceae bacterium]|nr:glycosyltransferase family 4 protein [Thermoleophilaceae bacterium]